MRRHTIRALRVCCSPIFVAAAVGVAEAQAPVATPESPPSVFRQVIPKPTGRNGYEELLAAGDALTLIRRGLAKPVFSPRERVTTDTLFPEFAPFQSLARLLAMQQYILLADGRLPEVLESFQLGLRLALAVQTDTLLSGLVGRATSGAL